MLKSETVEIKGLGLGMSWMGSLEWRGRLYGDE
jgi:hypothetical protein